MTRPHRQSPRRLTVSRTEGLVPKAAHLQLRRHRCHVGIAACRRRPVQGARRANATVAGSCRDTAGNVAEAGQPFQYDARRRPSPSPSPWSRRASRRSSGSVRRMRPSSSSSARRDQREEEDHCLQRQRCELHRQDRAQGRSLSLRDPGQRRRRQHGREGRHSRRRHGGALFKLAAGAAVRAPLVLAWEAVKGSDASRRPALPERQRRCSPFGRRRRRSASARPGAMPASCGASSAGSTTGTSGARGGTLAKPQYGKLLGSNTFVVK